MNMKDALTKEFSIEERQKMASGLIAKNVEQILSKEVIKARSTMKDKIDITLKAKQCRDSDDDIRSFLALYGFREIIVSSDFPGYCESYEGTTRIKFRI